jgi:hypothetical protein
VPLTELPSLTDPLAGVTATTALPPPAELMVPAAKLPMSWANDTKLPGNRQVPTSAPGVMALNSLLPVKPVAAELRISRPLPASK